MGETTDRHRVKSGSPFNYLQHGPNGIIQPLLTDLYQVTMAYGYWKSGRHEDTAVFDLFFRKNPFDGEFTIFGGLEECLKFVEKFHFTDEAIDYLRSVLPEMTEDGFFDFLRNLDGSQLSIHGIPEGSVVFPKEPLIRIEGPLAIAQLLETTFLTLVNYASLVSTNAARFRMASGEKVKLVEFGLRRAQGPDGGLSASKYVYMGGFDGTSNLLAGKLYDIPVYGTHAHSFVSSFGSLNDLPVEKRKLKNLKTGVNVDLHEICTSYRSELLSCLGVASHQPNEGEYTAFMAYAIAFPTGFLALVDTYNTLVSGIPNFLTIVLALNELGYAAKGIRLDSGDLAYLSIRCRKMFKTAAKKFNIPSIEKLVIIASNDINEETIYALREQGNEINTYGVGTHLVTCQRQPALGCVYKLVCLKGTPKLKLSEEPKKISIPDKKRLFRLYGASGEALIDILLPHDATEIPERGSKMLCRHPFSETRRCYVTPTSVQELLVPQWENGKRVNESKVLSDVREYVINSLKSIRNDHKRRLNPTPYKLSLSQEMYEKFHNLWLQDSPIGELV